MTGTPRTLSTDEGRTCTVCKLFKPWDQFNKSKLGHKRYRARCRSCDNKVGAKWKVSSDYYAKNRESILAYKKLTYCPLSKKNYDLQRKYGITLDEFEQMFESQGGKCCTCKKQLDRFVAGRGGSKTGAVVDHCHDTGVVRGLLCSVCNRAIGLLNDDPKLLRAAAKYLETISISRQ